LTQMSVLLSKRFRATIGYVLHGFAVVN
jgi:hypothetical protein